MDVYIYSADIYCQECGEEIIRALDGTTGKPPLESREDSNIWPQGPYPDGGGEADCPQHCGGCNGFLENPLTRDGYDYVQEQIDCYPQYRNRPILNQWAEFYGIEESTMTCNECEMLSINGVACHETGCPNASARYEIF